MEIVQGSITLKQIFKDHWEEFVELAQTELNQFVITSYMAYNI